MISPCHGLGRFVYELRFLNLPDQHVSYFREGPSNELSIRLRQSQMKRPILQYISKMSELILLENTLPHPTFRERNCKERDSDPKSVSSVTWRLYGGQSLKPTLGRNVG